MEEQSPTTGDQMAKRPRGHRVSRKVRACTPCRQQKLKCDALSSASRWCSRCTANGIACFFSDTFERKKARSKAELQQEIDQLRRHVQSPRPPPAPGPDPSLALDDGPESRPWFNNEEMHQDSSTARLQPEPIDVTPTSTAESSSFVAAAVASSYVAPPPPLRPSQRTSGATSSRSLDGVHIEAIKISDCFTLFFKHYHPIFPIFDPSWDIDTFYSLSPFVFWCIVATGSRRYDLDPTILHRLAPGVQQLALRSIPQFGSYLPTICGLIMLCVWPLPMKTMHEDLSLVYSGAAMQIALQHGLHLFPRSQACERPVPFRSITHDASLARVWAYVEFVCHCTSWTMGTPPHFLSDAFDLGYYTDDIATSMAPSTRWMQKFERFYTRAMMAVTDMTQVMDQDPGNEAAALGSMIKVFDEQIRDIGQKALDDISSKPSRDAASDRSSAGNGSVPAIYPNSLIVTISRIHLQAHLFLAPDPSLHLPALTELFFHACRWTEQATAMDRATDWALYSSESYFRHTILVASIILRISHSPLLKHKVDQALGERSYFATVRLLKRRSLQSTDVNAQSAELLAELWHSHIGFRRPDGTCDSLYVRIRRRGVMGAAYDCVWPSSDSGENTTRGSQAPPSTLTTSQLTRPTPVPYTFQECPAPGEPGDDTDPVLLEMASSNAGVAVGTEMFDLMSGSSSFDILYNDFQWTQDDCFWT